MLNERGPLAGASGSDLESTRAHAVFSCFFLIIDRKALIRMINEKDIEACYDAGANTYVQKPVNLAGFMESIRIPTAWMSRSRSTVI